MNYALCTMQSVSATMHHGAVHQVHQAQCMKQGGLHPYILQSHLARDGPMGIYNANVSELFSQGSSALFGRDGFLTKYFEAATRLPITPSIYTLHPSFHLIHPLIPPSSSPYIHSSPHFSSYIFSSLHHPLHTYTPPFISPHTPSHPSILLSIYTLSP